MRNNFPDHFSKVDHVRIKLQYISTNKKYDNGNMKDIPLLNEHWIHYFIECDCLGCITAIVLLGYEHEFYDKLNNKIGIPDDIQIAIGSQQRYKVGIDGELHVI